MATVEQAPSSGFRYLFGPVPSRRFGRSLGVDLLPFKTCSLNCVFCEVGRTTCLTSRRAEYVPTADVLRELVEWEAQGGETDFVTLAGSGEPTLHTGFGAILDAVRRRGRFRSALLSNGTLMTDPAVRRDAAKADVVKLSLSAWDAASFERMHRPHPDVNFSACLDAYRLFREGYDGELWIEVFLLAGLNDSDEAIRRISSAVAGVRPDRIHLNSVARPPAEPWAAAVSEERMRAWAGMFTPTALTPGTFSTPAGRPAGDARDAIVAILRRRPSTAAQLAAALGMEAAAVGEILAPLIRAGAFVRRPRGGEIYISENAENR